MSILPSVALLTADAPSILGSFLGPQWGIFGQDGRPILASNNILPGVGRLTRLAFGAQAGGAVTQATRALGVIGQSFGVLSGLVDSVGSVEYRRAYDVSSYPQEQGAFQSYNKVQEPYEATVTVLSSLTRQQLLATLEPVVQSLQLVAVVMPEWGYPSANLTGYRFRRTVQNGVTLIAVEVECKEIRDARTMLGSTATPSQQPSSAGTSKPVGLVNVNKTPATGQESGFGGSGTSGDTSGAATDTGSTNAAYPTSSGPVVPTDKSSLSSPWIPIPAPI